MRIEWRHFAVLGAIRQTGSLTAAARRLGLTQSAASHQVKEAERRLGVALLTRRGRTVVLTRAGDSLADAAVTCAPVLEGAVARATETGLGNMPRLRLAHGPQDGLAWTASLYRRLQERDEPARLDLIACEQGRVIERLRDGGADLALLLGAQNYGDLYRQTVGWDELCCLLPPAHALNAAAAVTADQVARETYLAHSLTPQHGFEFERFFRPSGALPAHVGHVGSLAAIVDLVRAGAGLTIQPRSTVADRLERGDLAARPLAPTPIRLPWSLYWREDDARRLNDGLISDIADLLAAYLDTAGAPSEQKAV